MNLLDDVPYRLYEDLALVCLVEIPVDSNNMGTVLIHNSHICMWGIKQDKLFEDAFANAFAKNKVCIKKLTDTIMNEYANDIEVVSGNTKYEIPLFNDSEQVDCGIYDLCRNDPNTLFVLSNDKLINGATVITYPNVLKNIAEALECDFYIIPSSIHEVIILPDSISGAVSNLNSMIRTVNLEVVDRQEILSEHAYKYSLSTDKITSILDTVEGQNVTAN